MRSTNLDIFQGNVQSMDVIVYKDQLKLMMDIHIVWNLFHRMG
jgi:hypothetical protein